tara:strand:- start:94 stop:1221 length:1128 start_codon:yes stop_codon:yes gene_type:complete
MKIDIQFCMNFKKIGMILFMIFIAFISGFLVNMYDIYPSEIKEFYISNGNNNEDSIIFETDIGSLIHVTNNISKNEIKNNLINHLWEQNTLPNNELSKIEKNISLDKYSELNNLESIDKLTIEMEYGVNSIAYLFKPSTSNDKLIIYHQGHRGDFFEGKQTIAYFLEKNYTIIAFSMPLLGMNSQPVVDIPQFGKIKIHSHNQMELLETETFSPIKFFVEPIILTMNYLEKNYNFDSYYMIGISGGGWTTTMAAAIDDRISQSISVAGSYPMFLRSDTKNFGDYEQHNLELYKIANYLDLYVMASVGEDRKFIQIFNLDDPCCFGGTSFQEYEDYIVTTVEDFDDGYFKIYLDDTHREHKISDHALEIINNEFLD